MNNSSSPRGERLVGAPVVRSGGHWWLISASGSILATDPTFTGELDRFAAARAAAEREIAQLAPGRRRWSS
ncbi:hypothetical protein [Kitasatospora sp. NRRL B-11411]|uniref:hypothetical protein n=1 Tax=Kitasatospora sp. NRRL B-11411 TaxID=1463822 RepID=UPI0004C46611|nr:hypothetical protein [Kitasatospora sp. NRRL B-11411]